MEVPQLAPAGRGIPPTKVISVLTVLFLILFLTCVLAPWFGRDTTDAIRESARPETGWFPPLIGH